MALVLRTFEVVQQLEYYDLKDITGVDKEEFIKRIKSIQHLKEFAYIVHDKDVNEQQELKSKHFHLVVRLTSPVSVDTISKMLNIETQYINKIKTTTNNAYLYLVHFNDQNKYAYDKSDVISNFDYNKMFEVAKFNINDIINKITNGEIREFNYTKYISDLEYNRYKKQIKNAFEYRKDKLEYEKEGKREMQVIFITGESGAGKTTSAKKYCDDINFSFYISSGGKNLLDDYKGQDCIILDDLRDTDYKFNDLLKLLDNNTSSNASARYYNKSINECKLLIITSCKPIEEWYTNLLYKGFSDSSQVKDQATDYEQKKQFFRRITFYMEVTKKEVNFKIFNSEENEFKTVCTMPNELIEQYEQNQKEVEQMLTAFGNVFKKKS